MKSYKQVAFELAEEAGKIMKANFATGKRDWKVDHTPLTIADTSINKLVVETIAKDFSSHGVLGEEESNIKDSEFMWICDPVDGTIPYSHGIPNATFTIALVQNGIPILGLIYDPFMDRLFIAEKGKGSFMNNKNISVSSLKKLANSTINVEGWSLSLYDFDNLRTELEKLNVKTLKLSAYVYSGMLVAKGELLAALFPNTSPWDVAALKVIVEEAGGKCTDMQGNDQKYNTTVNGFLCSNGLVHEEILNLVNNFAKKRVL